MSPTRRRVLSILPALALGAVAACGASPAAGEATAAPRVLLVTAHPDDEAVFAGAAYKIAHSLRGSVDLAVVTNGEGGFRYAALAESIHGLELTREAIGRAHLPRIRKAELMAAGALLGVREFFFLDQPDGGYTERARAVLEEQWDAAAVRGRLRQILLRGGYDFVFVLLPTASTHGAHQASALLLLEAVESLPAGERPAVLGSTDHRRGDPRPEFGGRPEFPATRVRAGAPLEFDRRQKFGYLARLDYRIVVNWVIAEHKSQGLMQTLVNDADAELFFVFALNDGRGAEAAAALFARLAPEAAGSPGPRVGAETGRHFGVCPIDP
jgi:LmbE family N-acetylglucosaminyl deacetylase